MIERRIDRRGGSAGAKFYWNDISIGAAVLNVRPILRLAQANRPSTPHTWTLASIAAAQAAVSAIILIYGYRFAGERQVIWAVVSAVLVLQPGFHQSLAASVTRMIANIVGAVTGLVVGLLVPEPTAAVVVALVLVILQCELYRLDLGVRSACASVIIVMMAGNGPTWENSVHRVVAVAIGCSLAIILQLLTDPILRRLGMATAAQTPAAQAAPPAVSPPASKPAAMQAPTPASASVAGRV